MAFTPTAWVDGTIAITATQLNRIETGVDDAHAGAIDDGSLTTSKLGAVTYGSTSTQVLTTTAWLLPAGFWYIAFDSSAVDAQVQVTLGALVRNVLNPGNRAEFVMSDGTLVKAFITAGGSATLYYMPVTFA